MLYQVSLVWSPLFRSLSETATAESLLFHLLLRGVTAAAVATCFMLTEISGFLYHHAHILISVMYCSHVSTAYTVKRP